MKTTLCIAQKTSFFSTIHTLIHQITHKKNNNMTSHPYALDASPSERRALRFKCFTFYGKWEPNKSVPDVNDLCEWALENGVQAFNDKLRSKYGEDLNAVSINSYLDLTLETQVKLFYSEFDPHKPGEEIEKIAAWARSRGPDGTTEINRKMNQKYGENLNTMAFGGRIQMRHLLEAYFEKVDPLRATPENVQVSIEYVVHNGALALIRELVERYKVGLQLSVMEIQGKDHEIEIAPSAKDTGARPAVMSLMRGQMQPVNPDGIGQNLPPAVNHRPVSAAFSQTSSTHKFVWTVSEDQEIRGLMEVFYAKYNPEKLASGGVDALMKYARINGLESANGKLQEKYGEDLDTLKVQYDALIDQLTKFYAKVDPSKKNIDDLAAWAIVNGPQTLSDRLEKRYGKGLYDDEVDQQIQDPDVLRSRVALFYETFDKQPKSEQEIEIIVSWVMSGASISQLNKKLKTKYGTNLNDLPPLEVGEMVTTTTTTKVEEDGPTPEPMGGGGVSPSRSPSTSTTTRPLPPANHVKQGSSFMDKIVNRERTDSFASGTQEGVEQMEDKMNEQMRNMRRITSGQYDDLAMKIRAFYRRHDEAKLENKEALDLVLKWTFKHGKDALNKKFMHHYGSDLENIVLDDNDFEEEEGDDFVPDW